MKKYKYPTSLNSTIRKPRALDDCNTCFSEVGIQRVNQLKQRTVDVTAIPYSESKSIRGLDI